MSRAKSNGVPLAVTPKTDAERAVLGAMLRENAAIGDVRQTLSTSDFTTDANQRVFRAIQDLDADGIRVDTVILADRLKQNGDLDDVGYPYLAEL
jgi:replicative DNA helicase